MLSRIADWLERLLAPASRIANNIGISMLIVLTLLTVFNVLMRFITGMSFTPMKELSEYALSILVFLTIPYCAFRGAHVVVDLVTMHLSRRTQARVEAVICLLSVVLCGLITWQLFVRGIAAMNSGEESTMLRIWLAPFVFIAGIGFLMLALIYLTQWLRVLKETRK